MADELGEEFAAQVRELQVMMSAVEQQVLSGANASSPAPSDAAPSAGARKAAAQEARARAMSSGAAASVRAQRRAGGFQRRDAAIGGGVDAAYEARKRKTPRPPTPRAHASVGKAPTPAPTRRRGGHV